MMNYGRVSGGRRSNNSSRPCIVRNVKPVPITADTAEEDVDLEALRQAALNSIKNCHHRKKGNAGGAEQETESRVEDERVNRFQHDSRNANLIAIQPIEDLGGQASVVQQQHIPTTTSLIVEEDFDADELETEYIIEEGVDLLESDSDVDEVVEEVILSDEDEEPPEQEENKELEKVEMVVETEEDEDALSVASRYSFNSLLNSLQDDDEDDSKPRVRNLRLANERDLQSQATTQSKSSKSGDRPREETRKSSGSPSSGRNRGSDNQRLRSGEQLKRTSDRPRETRRNDVRPDRSRSRRGDVKRPRIEQRYERRSSRHSERRRRDSRRLHRSRVSRSRSPRSPSHPACLLMATHTTLISSTTLPIRRNSHRSGSWSGGKKRDWRCATNKRSRSPRSPPHLKPLRSQNVAPLLEKGESNKKNSELNQEDLDKFEKRRQKFQDSGLSTSETPSTTAPTSSGKKIIKLRKPSVQDTSHTTRSTSGKETEEGLSKRGKPKSSGESELKSKSRSSRKVTLEPSREEDSPTETHEMEDNTKQEDLRTKLLQKRSGGSTGPGSRLFSAALKGTLITTPVPTSTTTITTITTTTSATTSNNTSTHKQPSSNNSKSSSSTSKRKVSLTYTS